MHAARKKVPFFGMIIIEALNNNHKHLNTSLKNHHQTTKYFIIKTKMISYGTQDRGVALLLHDVHHRVYDVVLTQIFPSTRD